MFFKIGILKNVKIFTAKHLCCGLFNEVIKKRLQCRRYPVNILKFLRAPIFTGHLWWLLLTNVYRTLDYHKLRQITFMYKKKIELISYSQLNSKSK